MADAAPVQTDKLFPAQNRYKINGNGNLYDFHRLGLDYLKMGNRPMRLQEKELVVRIAVELLGLLDGNNLEKEEFIFRARKVYDRALEKQASSRLAQVYRWYYH